MALATSPAVAKLSPVLPAVTLPVLSAVRVDLLISKVISVPLALAVVPVPLTKPMSLLVLFRVSTLLPFTEVVSVCRALSALARLSLLAWLKST